jgi:hypothetical protein
MNTFETYIEKINKDEDVDQKYTDLAIHEIKEKLRDQILFLKKNSKDVSIKDHLACINKENKDSLLESLDDSEMIDFNEVILKGKWKEYLAKKSEDKLTKYEKVKLSDKIFTAADINKEGKSPNDDFKLSFRAMIDHYATNLEIEENLKKKETEREQLKKEFKNRLSEIEKNKPHVVAAIKALDLDIFRKPDYEAIINLDERNLGDYKKGLKKYFDLKTDSTAEKRTLQQKANMIINDPRFRYYCALRELLSLEGLCTPEIFLNN